MNKESSTVYVIQHSPGKDLMPAKEFGQIKILLSSADTHHLPIDGLIQKLQAGLKPFQPHDYLLLIGDPAAIGIATYIAMHNTHGFIRLLRWRRESYEYEALNIGVV
jgi:hypothetical protein